MKFRKKPVVIDAVRWDGRSIDSMLAFLATGAPLPKAPDDPHVHTGVGFTPPLGTLDIPTLEGTVTAQPGDWIIKGVAGEFYPCKPDIFAATYERVESSFDQVLADQTAEIDRRQAAGDRSPVIEVPRATL